MTKPLLQDMLRTTNLDIHVLTKAIKIDSTEITLKGQDFNHKILLSIQTDVYEFTTEDNEILAHHILKCTKCVT